MIKAKEWTIFVDGAARGNPGSAGVGIHVTQNEETIIEEGFYFGIKTNNQAEYLALALALHLILQKAKAHSFTIAKLTINSDSELLIKQMLGIYRVKNPILKKIKKLIEEILSTIPCVFTHVRRKHNVTADRLANEGIDTKNTIPASFAKLLEQADITEML